VGSIEEGRGYAMARQEIGDLLHEADLVEHVVGHDEAFAEAEGLDASGCILEATGSHEIFGRDEERAGRHEYFSWACGGSSPGNRSACLHNQEQRACQRQAAQA
jgi:hypothetical protein